MFLFFCLFIPSLFVISRIHFNSFPTIFCAIIVGFFLCGYNEASLKLLRGLTVYLKLITAYFQLHTNARFYFSILHILGYWGHILSNFYIVHILTDYGVAEYECKTLSGFPEVQTCVFPTWSLGQWYSLWTLSGRGWNQV